MKIICVNNTLGNTEQNLERVLGLTEYKIYNVIDENKLYYNIINDDGCSYWFIKRRFENLELFREKKINRILYDC